MIDTKQEILNYLNAVVCKLDAVLNREVEPNPRVGVCFLLRIGGLCSKVISSEVLGASYTKGEFSAIYPVGGKYEYTHGERTETLWDNPKRWEYAHYVHNCVAHIRDTFIANPELFDKYMRYRICKEIHTRSRTMPYHLAGLTIEKRREYLEWFFRVPETNKGGLWGLCNVFHHLGCESVYSHESNAVATAWQGTQIDDDALWGAYPIEKSGSAFICAYEECTLWLNPRRYNYVEVYMGVLREQLKKEFQHYKLVGLML